MGHEIMSDVSGYSLAKTDKKVKWKLPRVLWGHESARRVFACLSAIANEDGIFALDAATIAQQLGLSRPTVYRAIGVLVQARLVALVEARRGRGQHSIYRLTWHQRKLTNPSTKKSVSSQYKDKNRDKTHSKDSREYQCALKTTEAYQGPEAAKVTLVLGARFYRHVMKSIRLGLESWSLSEPVRHALEGFFGLRIDGASLTYARELASQIWAIRREIEALAAKGASPKRVCSFVAGRLAGIHERSRREVLKRTAQLISEVEQLDRRIAGLRAWLREREADYRAGQVCKRCGYRHSQAEYRSGYRDDGDGLVCVGWARMMIDELREQAKIKRRRECCRVCGGSLRNGHVEGVCWTCYELGKSRLEAEDKMFI